ncbi:GntR family transcriptional regulator [Labedaea rhizosphaerae]|uniref:Regulatory GntR family protein n=1 Tax=Labedaea rhizosphaerae TaxID=598644 RepID=A0A4R6SJP5_LABRH|nr:GntR family transcriptional regulator [Labedaea rhizosphaerae]TDQ01228.1 regulatory GntR family protein [Labedaea rhizosphaerae]
MYDGRAPDGRHPYQRIADVLRLEIEAGKYAPGTALPSTRDLEKRFGVSRMTVRSAVHTLHQEGLVRPQHGKGVFVRRLDDQAVLDTPIRSDPGDTAGSGSETDQPGNDPVISRLDALNERVEGGLGIVLERLDAIEQRLT